MKNRGLLVLLGALLALLPGRAADLVLENSHARLVFDDGGNEFLLKSFVMEGTELVPEGGSKAYPWGMEFLGPRGESPWLEPKWSWYDGGRLESDGQAAVFTWRLFLEGRDTTPVRMRVALSADDPLPRWHLEADLPEGWVVTWAEFPRIAVRRPEGAKGILPVGFGTEYTLGASGQLKSDYPSCTGTMQLTLMHWSEGTVYFSAQDREANGKFFYIKSEGNQVVFQQGVLASYAWSDGGHFSIPWESVLGFTRDPWQEAALRWYRPFTFDTAWGRRTLAERDIAPWIKKADFWIRPADATEETMTSVRQALRYYGKDTGLHWYYWHAHKFDTNYPDYFPAQEGFAAMVAEAQALGGHVTPYINGRLWDPANPTYEALDGASASCRKRDGSLYTEVYSSKAVNTVTCPASPIWQDVLKDVNRRLLEEYGTDGVYIDQIGAALCQPCYAPGHPHAPGGGAWWPAAYRDMMTTMKAEVYPAGKAVTTEENAECYIDLFDMMLVVNSPHNAWTRMVPLFPLIYADRCIYSGYTYVPGRINDGSLAFMSMKSLLWGSQLGWVNPALLMREDNAEPARFLKNLTRLRKASHDLFVGGRFLGEFVPGGDNPEQDIPGYQRTPVVMGATWATAQGREAWVVVNMSNQRRTVTLPDGRGVSVAPLNGVRLWK